MLPGAGSSSGGSPVPDRRGSIPCILRMIRENRFSAAGLAAALGLTQDQLGDRLALMVRQGYLARVDAGSPGTGMCACRCCCQPCSERAASPTGYRLTEKGRRVASMESDPLTSRVQGETG